MASRAKPSGAALWAHYWAKPAAELLAELATSRGGLSSAEASARRQRYGPNTVGGGADRAAWLVLLRQFRNPLVLILVFAAVVSLGVREWTDAAIVLAVVTASAAVGFWYEYRASSAVERLRARIRSNCPVRRDGATAAIPAEDVVPGDILLLSAGSLIPADAVVLEAKDFFVIQSVLTGETFPAEKMPGTAAADAPLAERTNCIFMGTSVMSGTAQAVVVHTGLATELGRIAHRLRAAPEETEFERGLHRFGNLLTQVMAALVVGVFAIHVYHARPVLDSLLFSIALAVGLSPELLPAVMTGTLAAGARRMAERGVIVRRLRAIENLGAMDVLCTDKTGTITEGLLRLEQACDPEGQASPAVARDAVLNAAFHTGFPNPLDDALIQYGRTTGIELSGYEKIDEMPYDFIRKRLSVLVKQPDGALRAVTKGAFEEVLAICSAEAGTLAPLSEERREVLRRRFARWGSSGYRVLALAVKPMPPGTKILSRDDETDLEFAGFLLFFDPPKADARQTIAELNRLGVELKVISGDNQYVTRHVAEQLGLPSENLLTGADLAKTHDDALWSLVQTTSLFAQVDPSQKERIIRALRHNNRVVGYMGDGINDATALRAADVGISVNTAVDVAKEAADFVLLEQDLGVLAQGIQQGRRTFANTIKYIFTTASANFGNMFSMAGASLFLPFLPLLAKQILLNNFLSDIPSVGIAADHVDREWMDRPRRWDVRFIRDFMLVFGLVSSVFDYLTFGALLMVFHASVNEFRTAWFAESLLTELVIALIVRTRLPFYKSRPGALLLHTTIALVILTLALPYLPGAAWFGFVPLPAGLWLLVIVLLALYVLAAELTKLVFYQRWDRGHAS